MAEEVKKSKSDSDGAKLEDSNLALYGSKVMKDVKLAAAKGEPAWKDAGKKVGIQVWRIEKFKVIAWDEKKYGQFFDGDSYIVLHTYKVEEKMMYNVHFWLGLETTQDEMGAAAYKTVELDDYLGDAPVQYREVQGSESDLFLKLFPKLTILSGGVASGFNAIKPEEYTPRLLHVKGNLKNVSAREVKLELKSLNHGDVFILDAGLQIYQWNGKTASIAEKRLAQEYTKLWQEQRNGRPKITILDDLEENKDFWGYIAKGGEYNKEIAEAAKAKADGKVYEGPAYPAPARTDIAAATSDEKVAPPTYEKSLHKVSDASGTLVVTKVKDGAAVKSDFKTDDAFIYNRGDTVFGWIGKGASAGERKNAIALATDFATKAGMNLKTTKIVRILEGSEPAGFFTSL